jgi:hypothetical protein
MSSVKITGNASGTAVFEIVSPGTSTNRTLTLPDGTGTIVASGVNSAITSGTAQASTSGTAILFSSIPSWVKRITVMFSGVSVTTGTTNLLVQVGSGSVQTTGYTSSVSQSTSTSTSTSGFIVRNLSSGANTVSGVLVLNLLSSNTWVGSGTANVSTASSCAGVVTLSGALDRVNITTDTSDTFDAGSINILYE